MRAVLSGWLAAAIIAALALVTVSALAPADDGRPVDEYAQVVRIHLPWLLFSVLMAFVGGYYVRARLTGWWCLVGALPVPLLATFAATRLGVPAAQSVVAIVLRLIEALLGVALGLLLVDRFRDDDSATGRRPGEAKGFWEQTRH